MDTFALRNFSINWQLIIVCVCMNIYEYLWRHTKYDLQTQLNQPKQQIYHPKLRTIFVVGIYNIYSLVIFRYTIIFYYEPHLSHLLFKTNLEGQLNRFSRHSSCDGVHSTLMQMSQA